MFQHVQDRQDIVLRIFQKTEQLFARTVSSAASHAAHSHIQIADTAFQCFDRVRKGKLLVIMRMDANVFMKFIAEEQIFVG